MRLLPALAALVLAGALWAQGGLRFEQLREMIRSSINQGINDRDIAKYLRTQKLAFALDERALEDLVGLGVGPRTFEALRGLQEKSRGMPPPAPADETAQPQGPPPPSAEEQARIIAEARRAALDYTERLPDFLCLQITRRYVDPSGLEMDWLKYDELKARVSYVDGHENYELVSVNNKVVSRGFEEVGGATSTGEFGSLLKELFDPRTNAEFAWARHSLLRARPVYVFRFRVPRERSKWRLSYTGGPGESSQQMITAYSGLVYIDKETERVLRIKMDTEDVPPSFPLQAATSRLDYDFIDIGGVEHLLPLKAEVRMRASRELTRNDVEFRLYRKFTADASISFDEIEDLQDLPAEAPGPESEP